MSTTKTLASERRRRKMMTALWIFLVTVAVIFLIYREMTAILYIVATVGVTVLLVVVAIADLAHAEAPGIEANDVTKRTS